MFDKIMKMVETLSNEERARLAALIPAEVDPTNWNIRVLYDNLKTTENGENVVAELVNQFQQWEND